MINEKIIFGYVRKTRVFGPENLLGPDPNSGFRVIRAFGQNFGWLGIRSGSRKIFGLGSGVGRASRQFSPECAALDLFSTIDLMIFK